MERIAVTLDEETLRALNAISAAVQCKTGGRTNRSLIVRTAVLEYAERKLRLEAEEKERAILARHQWRLEQQSKALIRDQAKR